MRKRNCRVEIYFTKTELETLTKKSERAACPVRATAAASSTARW